MKISLIHIVGLFIALSLLSCNHLRSRQENKKTITKELEQKIVEIDLRYIGMMCDCLQWATPENMELYEQSVKLGRVIPMDSLFIRIEPSNDSIINPFELEYSEPQFKFTGRFYKGKHEWISEDGIEYYCRVFRYDKCAIAM